MKQYIIQNAGVFLILFTVALYYWSRHRFPGPYSTNLCALFLAWFLVAQPLDAHSTYLIGSYFNFSTHEFEVNPASRFLFESIGFLPATLVIKTLATVAGIALFYVRNAVALMVVAAVTTFALASNYLQYYFFAL